MDRVLQTPDATQKLYQKGMQQTYEFEEKLLTLLTSFDLGHESSFLDSLPKPTAEAVYAYYDGRTALHEEVNGLRFPAVLKEILVKCQADSTGHSPTFEGTLRANFIELARSAFSDTRVFSTADQRDLGPLMGVLPLDTPHFETTSLELPSSKTAFDRLKGMYPDDPDLIVKFNGSCYTIQQLYNREKLPTDSDVNFFQIMTVVLEHCPPSSSSTATLRTAIRAYFVSLFNQYKDKVEWELGQKEAILKLMDSTEIHTKRVHFPRKQRERPPEKGTNWTPLWVVAGLFVTFLTYRYVAEPAYQWIRRPRVPVQQKV